MRANVLEAPGRIALRKIADPVPREGEVLVRVSHTGVCGTDVKIFNGSIPGRYPLVMGHETVGEVVGDGTRVLIDPTLSCGRCFYCEKGQTYLCLAGALMGRDVDGGFAELVAAPAKNCYGLPDAIDAAHAPLIQVLTTVHHAQTLAEIGAGDTVVILGLGVTGQLHVQLAKARGAGRVIAVSRNAEKRRLAETTGADVAADHGEEARRAIFEATGGLGADVVIESVGQVSMLAQAIDLVRAAGRIVPYGIYAEREAQLPFYQLYFKELRIINSRAAEARDFPASIALVRDGKVRLAPLISDLMPFTDLDKALAIM
ncbi:MAG: zinc-binding dehydrogenase, partial [Candidatus Rokubacteria bacterium]|nr:zinc-binding dehydrogenase [Candidatus Rokubacteria bacterium]